MSALEVIKDHPQDGRSQLYVARTGKPYPLEIHGSDEGNPAAITLSEYGKKVILRVPTAAESLDAARLR
ncbi:hypothetical protein ACH3VS_39465 [Streptomyces sp. WSLK1-3]|uniref:hypothetical protein n=1 Tax=Streptomyces sp. WSLK1-3 TaxID=3375475 RepID=UPI0037A1A295